MKDFDLGSIRKMKYFYLDSIRKNYKIGDRVTLKTKEELISDGYEENQVGSLYSYKAGYLKIYRDELNVLGTTHTISGVDRHGFNIIDGRDDLYFSWNVIKQLPFKAGQRVERTDMKLKGTVLIAEPSRCLVKPDVQSKCYWGNEYMKALTNEVREVHRIAKVGEWVKFTENINARLVGKIGKKLDDSDRFFEHEIVWMQGYNCADGYEKTYFTSCPKYVVLENYKPECEVLLKEKNYARSEVIKALDSMCECLEEDSICNAENARAEFLRVLGGK